MFEGQYLHYSSVAEASNKILSPWFPRQGDNLTVSVERIQNGGAGLKVSVLTKNSEDPGDGTAVGVAIVNSAEGVDSEEYTGLVEELVRYEFEVTGSAGQFVLFRMLSPIWRNSV